VRLSAHAPAALLEVIIEQVVRNIKKKKKTAFTIYCVGGDK